MLFYPWHNLLRSHNFLQFHISRVLLESSHYLCLRNHLTFSPHQISLLGFSSPRLDLLGFLAYFLISEFYH